MVLRKRPFSVPEARRMYRIFKKYGPSARQCWEFFKNKNIDVDRLTPPHFKHQINHKNLLENSVLGINDAVSLSLVVIKPWVDVQDYEFKPLSFDQTQEMLYQRRPRSELIADHTREITQ